MAITDPYKLTNTTDKPAFDLGTAYENNNKMKYRQQGIDALKPVEPFKADLASIQSDPTYQAAMESARQATQVAEGNISSALNRRGIMDSSITANAASNAAQQEYGRVNRELLPKLIEDQYNRYIDQNNMNRQYASDLFGVSDMYANDDQTNFNNAITESSVTGNYLSPEARALSERLITLKNSTESMWSTLSPEQRAEASAQADQLRARLDALGVNSSLFGADVTANNAQQNVGQAGLRTVQAQGQDFNQMDRDRNFDYGVGRDERSDFVTDRDFEYNQSRDKVADEQWSNEFNRLIANDDFERALQLAQQKVDESRERRLASGGSGGGSSSGGSSNEYDGGVISDVTMPRTVATMETWIINNVPGGNKVAGPPSPNQLEWIEAQILNNPNLSEKDLIKLYNRFGIPLPE